MNYPSSLTDAEWNLLNTLTTRNGMDCWFELRNASVEDSEFDCDYVHDIEEDIDINLHDGIEMVAEGLVEDDLDDLKDGRYIWNGLMDKFSLQCYRV